MDSKNLPKPDNEQYNPNLEAQDEDVVSGGSNRLMYILGAVVLALILGYIALPKGNGNGQSSSTPTFMLDDAAVTATAPTAADSVAAGLKGSTGAEEEDTKTTKSTTKTTETTRSNSAAGVQAGTPAVAAAVAPTTSPEATPEPASAPEQAPAPAPVAAAPANITMSGKIEDENGRPLVGATVLLKGSSKGTSTDANGNYTMEVPSGTDNTLIYGYGGYDDEVVRSRGSQPVNVTLTPREKISKRRR